MTGWILATDARIGDEIIIHGGTHHFTIESITDNGMSLIFNETPSLGILKISPVFVV